MTQTPDQYFDSLPWRHTFSEEIQAAARYYFHWLMLDGRIGKSEAAQQAKSYATGASWMKVKGEAQTTKDR